MQHTSPKFDTHKYSSTTDPTFITYFVTKASLQLLNRLKPSIKPNTKIPLQNYNKRKISNSINRKLRTIMEEDQNPEVFTEELTEAFEILEITLQECQLALNIYRSFIEKLNTQNSYTMISKRLQLAYKSCLLISLKFLRDFPPNINQFAENLDSDRVDLKIFENFLLEVLQYDFAKLRHAVC